MLANHGSVLVISIVLVGLTALVTACASDPSARLPESVSVAIVYNDQADRWHAGAIVAGDRPDSSLRVLCLTEAGKPEGDSGRTHTGVNIDVQPGDFDGRSGSDWSWRLDGQPWECGRWDLDFNTRPATVVASDADVEAA